MMCCVLQLAERAHKCVVAQRTDDAPWDRPLFCFGCALPMIIIILVADRATAPHMCVSSRMDPAV